jgi:hypothetical protein
MLALAIGTLLAVGALSYVLLPLLMPPAPRRAAPVVRVREGAGAEHEAVVALREIEFDRVTGKLSDADYAELKTRYTAVALEAMRASSEPVGAEDAVEAAVRAYRSRLKSCQRCGPRPEPDAVYCSSCGGYLAGRCAQCGSEVSEAGAACCSACGHALAA